LNISAKYHQNRSIQFRAIPFRSWAVFIETQCMCNTVRRRCTVTVQRRRTVLHIVLRPSQCWCHWRLPRSVEHHSGGCWSHFSQTKQLHVAQ